MKTKMKTLLMFILFATLTPIYAQPNLNKSDTIKGPIDINDVTIIGQRRNLISSPSSESSGIETTISKVNEIQIEKQGASTLIDAIKYVPGAMIESRGRQVKQFFSIRGERYPYPTFAIDGIWQREFEEMPYFISSSDLGSVEVIRSSNALFTGLSGTTGIINVKPKEYDNLQTNINMEYGSYESFKGHISHGNKINKINYATSLTMSHTDGPEDKHAAENITNAYGSLGWQISPKLKTKIYLFHFSGTRQLALAEEPAMPKLQTIKSWFDPIKSTLITNKTLYIPNDRMSTELSFSYAKRNTTLSTNTPLKVTAQTKPGEYTTLSSTPTPDSEVTLNLAQSVNIFKNNTLRLGGLYNYWLAPNGKRFYTGSRNEIATYSIVVNDEHRIGKLILDVGVRMTRVNNIQLGRFMTGEEKNVNASPIINKIEPWMYQATFGGSYLISKNYSLHTSIAKGQIKPMIGSLNSKKEATTNEDRFKAELGIKAEFDKVGELTINGFLSDQKDAIFLSSQTYVLADSTILPYYDNQDQNQQGVEIIFNSAQIAKLFHLFTNVTYLKSQKNIDNEWVKNKMIPEWIINGGVSASFKGFDINLYAKHLSKFENTRFLNTQVYTSPAQLGDFTELNSTISYTLKNAYSTRIYFEIFNITDERYSTVVGYPDFGRRFNLGVSLKI